MPADSSYQLGQTVGARVRAARLKKKFTQNQLARPDFSVSYVSAIERGQIQPSLRALEILAQRLEISATDLLPAHPVMETSLVFGDSLEPGGVRGELPFLEAQIALYQREPEKASEILRPYLPQKGERQQEKDSGLYFVLGWAFLEEKCYEESEQLLAEAARRAKDIADPWYPSILALQSIVYTAMHNTEQAAQLKRESLRLLAHLQQESDGNLLYLSRLHSSLAQYYSSIGEHHLAQEHLQSTLQLLSSDPSGRSLQENYILLFQTYLAQERYSLAMLNSSKWFFADLRSRLPGIRSELAYALGKVLVKSKQADAADYLESVAREAEARQDNLTLAGANAQRAFRLFEEGHLQEAERLAQLAREQAEPFEKTPIKAYIHILSGELAYCCGAYASGDDYFEAGLELFEQLGEREELIEYLARYAQLLEERNCIQKSLIFWKKAYEYRQKSNIISL